MDHIGDPCDRHPCARAYTAWYNPRTRGIVVLCAHCTRECELNLVAQGFELGFDCRHELTPALATH